MVNQLSYICIYSSNMDAIVKEPHRLKLALKYYFTLKDNSMLITRRCVPRTFLYTYKLLTDDFPIVQAFI